ncbi:MAG: nucleotidyltransferase [Clostridia bacterium]|nr:nucleotidyltransferase [Clostridia bacterium]
MKVLGIVVEYNPFHNGHLHHIEKSKELTGADFVVAVMSGNFVQRGNPAFMDKWERTKMALNNHVDLVIELPVIYATSSAEDFAFGAVSILHNLNIVNYICFGSESGNINLLKNIADILTNESYDYKLMLKQELDNGSTYPVARSNALYKYITSKNLLNVSEDVLRDVLSSSNNILGIEYLKALNKLNSPIKPYTIQRESSDYNDEDIIENFSSATSIRKAINEGNMWQAKNNMPDYNFDILKEAIDKGTCPINIDSFSKLFHFELSKLNNAELSQILGMNEGIENRIRKIAEDNFCLSDIAMKTKTKRYTLTHINRLLIHTLLGLKRQDIETFNTSGGPSYSRILGFNKNGELLLSQLKLVSKLKILTNPKNYLDVLSSEGIKMFNQEINATNIYNLCLPDSSNYKYNAEFKNSIIKS